MEKIIEQAVRSSTDFQRVRALSALALSTQLDAREQTCELHGAYMAEGVRHTGHGTEHWTGCTTCLQLARDERARKDQEAEAMERQRRIEQRVEEAGIPLRFRGKRFADYAAENEGQEKVTKLAAEYVSGFEASRQVGSSLIFAGTPGTGKSLLAMIVLQELCARGYSASYVTCQGLILAIRRTWGRDGEGREADIVQHYASTPLLVLDEIGLTAGTDNEKALLFAVLDQRYSDMLPTIFVSNLTQQEMQEFLGERLWDRIKETARWVPFDWPSYRKKAREDLAARVAGQHRFDDTRRSVWPPRVSSPEDWTRDAV